ncbi:MAG: bifunctional UDP-N-acetylglucosamine pyrophosphorylase / glucosamine-phosphate N-acetyltransferase [Alphaproteobacteria bacterium]|nr:bifunctional UDP-N-acetylglucosamine pyrophosphorylase / glucosamine-phosphate N-acetyltransferase [Alphaproteobacteria bacterium]
MSGRTCLTIVLAAGEGTRMRSSRPKVLHSVAGRSLLGHVLAALKAANTAVAVVVGPEHDDVSADARANIADSQVFVQNERRGTAHAVLAARAAIEKGADDVLVVFGDTPLIRPQTLEKLRDALANGAAVAVLGFRPADPAGYGRLVTQGTELLAIVEHADASEQERAIALCNGGLMGFDGAVALKILERIGNTNHKGEFYLTDAVAIARSMKLRAVALEVTEDEVSGINTKAQLATAEATMQQRLRQAALDAGVTLVAPETVYLAADTKLGQDVTIEPYVVFGPGVTVEEGATIRSFSHLAGAQVGRNAIVGPFARLRPGAQLEEGVHVGNFVEIKEALIEAGAKANHLSYIGDARVGAGANVGAGTITCNYDGAAKHRTDIGKGAFIGSNSALVAPVKIGDGAYVGSGSVITADVPADALALGRGRQTIKEGWAKRLRELKSLVK